MFDRIKEKRMERKREKMRRQKNAVITMVVFASVMVLFLIIGIASEKNSTTDLNSGSSTFAVSKTTYEDNSDVEKSESNSPKAVKLKTTNGEISLKVGEKCDYASFYSYASGINLKDSEYEVVSDNSAVAKVDIKETDKHKVRFIISGISKGEASITVKSDNDIITSEAIRVIVDESDFDENDNNYEDTPIKLNSDEDEITIKGKGKSVDLSLNIDDWFTDLTDYKFKAYSADKNIAKVEIQDVDSQNITLLITGVGVGKTNISVKSEDGNIISDSINITVKKSSKSSKPKIPAVEESTADSEDRTVYITPNGNCYHTEYCRYLRGNKIKTTLKKAKAKGLRACLVCSP